MNFLTKLFGSLDTTSNGYSGRKLSAMAGVITGIYITIKLIPGEFQIEALYAWLAFSLLCLGIVTVEQIIRFKGGPSGTTTESTTTTTETTKP